MSVYDLVKQTCNFVVCHGKMEMHALSVWFYWMAYSNNNERRNKKQILNKTNEKRSLAVDFSICHQFTCAHVNLRTRFHRYSTCDGNITIVEERKKRNSQPFSEQLWADAHTGFNMQMFTRHTQSNTRWWRDFFSSPWPTSPAAMECDCNLWIVCSWVGKTVGAYFLGRTFGMTDKLLVINDHWSLIIPALNLLLALKIGFGFHWKISHSTERPTINFFTLKDFATRAFLIVESH